MMGPDPNYKVFNEDIEIKLKEIGELIGTQLPPGWGFTLLLFDFNNPKGAMFYISNGQRDDVVAMMKEFIKMKEDEDAGQTKN